MASAQRMLGNIMQTEMGGKVLAHYAQLKKKLQAFEESEIQQWLDGTGAGWAMCGSAQLNSAILEKTKNSLHPQASTSSLRRSSSSRCSFATSPRPESASTLTRGSWRCCARPSIST